MCQRLGGSAASTAEDSHHDADEEDAHYYDYDGGTTITVTG
jgi:hypothetical protein